MYLSIFKLLDPVSEDWCILGPKLHWNNWDGVIISSKVATTILGFQFVGKVEVKRSKIWWEMGEKLRLNAMDFNFTALCVAWITT